MKALDRILVAVLAVGIWAVAAGQFFAPSPVYSQSGAGFDRREIRQAVNSCRVQGPIFNNQIDATIVCR